MDRRDFLKLAATTSAVYTMAKLNTILKRIMGAVRHVERFLGPDDDWVERYRRIVFLAAQRLFGRIHTFVAEKTRKEYLTTVHDNPDTVKQILLRGSYQRNVAANRKYRITDGNREWAVSSLVYDPRDTDWQHHVYLFTAPDNTTDVYSHTETSVREGYNHLTNPQEDATPMNLFNIFDRRGVEYGRRQF